MAQGKELSDLLLPKTHCLAVLIEIPPAGRETGISRRLQALLQEKQMPFPWGFSTGE
jgi:hypothetical protein